MTGRRDAEAPSGEYVDSNRSLQRGITILRAFRTGAGLLGNGEIADRTGLSKSTVSRLTQTLVGCGMLEHVPEVRAYRLAAPVLSLAHAMRTSSPALTVAGPLMRRVAERRKINVGLAVADGDEMVYLESVRYSRRVAWRNVVAGQRVPIALTSLGRAWLAAIDDGPRRVMLARLRALSGDEGPDLLRQIGAAIADVERTGYCWASWQPQVVALATPIVTGPGAVSVLNMSVSGDYMPSEVVASLGGPLLELAAEIVAGLDATG